MFVIPRGLVRFQMNIGEEISLLSKAICLVLVLVLLLSLFGSRPSVPNDVLTKAFQVEQSVVDPINSKFA